MLRRRQALDSLRMRGGLTVNELARELRITRGAAANQITRLIADGLVVSSGLQASGRRPSVIYALTAKDFLSASIFRPTTLHAKTVRTRRFKVPRTSIISPPAS